jgi:hypothetical protein
MQSIKVCFLHDSSQQTVIIFSRKIYWFIFIIDAIGSLCEVQTELLDVLLRTIYAPNSEDKSRKPLQCRHDLQ